MNQDSILSNLLSTALTDAHFVRRAGPQLSSGPEVPGEGPVPAQIMVVGEAPGAEEERTGHPFVGASGRELDKLLHEAGILRSACFVSNVCRHRPPKNQISEWISWAKTMKSVPPGFVAFNNGWVHPNIAAGFTKLKKEISLVKPQTIICFGNLSMWALTGKWGISKWRGSQLEASPEVASCRVLPTYHPAYILRDWGERAAVVRDLQRARGEWTKPEWKFVIRPSFEQAVATFSMLRARLESGLLKLTHDLETRNGHIACSGIAWSSTEAICVPFMCVERAEGYWTEEQEAVLVYLHYAVLTHPNARVVNQNYLYDAQYTYRHWHFVARFWRDTMIQHHVAFCELPKALDYQASLYCEHYRYWKDDGRDWNPKMGEDQLWIYNCEDCVRTYECETTTDKTIEKFGLRAVSDFQHELFYPTLRAMKLGIRLSDSRKDAMRKELIEAQTIRQAWLEDVCQQPLNVKSPKQMQAFFFEDLQQPVQLNRKTKRPTTNDEALEKIAKRQPLLKPIVKRIQELRSIGVFRSTFIEATLDRDGRLRCSFNPCGTYTFRYSSSESAFWTGTNLQNIPKGVEAKEPEDLELPNIRKLFVPDVGYTFFDLDLDRADLQVVVWEADDTDLKAKLRLGIDMHCAAAVDIWDIKGIPIEELTETHPNYWEHRGRIGGKRQTAKGGVHATNYYCQPPTFAAQFGTTIKEADRFQQRWFGAHPGIKAWHERTKAKLDGPRPYVDNIFGYKWFLFDRPSLPDALAWQPQSVVGRVINSIWINLYKHAHYIQVLLQVHDSLAGQFPTAFHSQALTDFSKHSRILVPYSDPLYIPVGLKVSESSWGECEKLP